LVIILTILLILFSSKDKLANPKPAAAESSDTDDSSAVDETELDKWASNIHSSAPAIPGAKASPFQVFCKYRQVLDKYKGADAVIELESTWEGMSEADRVVRRRRS